MAQGRRVKISKNKIRFAKQAKVDLYRKGIVKILAELGHEEAWVSDESILWDFSVITGPHKGTFEVEDDRFLSTQDLSRILGVGVELDDRLWQIAKRIEEKSS